MRPLAFLSLSLFACVAHAAETKRPNILFIAIDDLRPELGCYGSPIAKSPHMDRLATEGVRFRNAFVTLSLCAPSRAAYLTGRYNHANGVANNHTPFPLDSVTHASLLRTAGYQTAYIGKWHMGGGGDQPIAHAACVRDPCRARRTALVGRRDRAGGVAVRVLGAVLAL